MTARRISARGLVAVALAGAVLTAGCSEPAPPVPEPESAPTTATPDPPAEAEAGPALVEVPRPRGLKILSSETRGTPGQLVAQAVTRTEIMNEVVPYLEYLAARDGLREGIVYLFDRTPEEAGVPLEPVSYFRFYLGEVVLRSGQGAFVENTDYFKDDDDPTPNGDEIALGHAISEFRVDRGLTELGKERVVAELYAQEQNLNPETTWRSYARVLDDSVSMGKEYFLKQGAKGGGSP